MLVKANLHRSITTKLVFSILINTALLLLAMSLLINNTYRREVPIESHKLALNEIEKIASVIAYPLWYLDSAHVMQIIKNGIEKSELITSINVKTRIENRNKPEMEIAWGKTLYTNDSYHNPIIFNSNDTLITVGEITASFKKHSPTIKHVIKDQFISNSLIIIVFTSLLILIQIVAIQLLISKPLKAVKNSLIKFKKTGIRKKIDWKSNDEFGDFLSAHNDAIDYSNKLEEELSNAKLKAEKANRAKSIFLSHMSHELRTPLTAILGFTQILQGDKTLNKEQADYINTISSCGDHLLNVINNILTLSKIESGEVIINNSSFNLQNLVKNVISALQIKANEKQLYLKLNIQNELPNVIRSDENKLRQILFNIIGNAIKFTNNGGITLAIKSVFLNENKYSLEFTISDTGQGIPKEDLKSIFLPFKQSEAGQTNNESTGLGLSISKDFIEMMGGGISVFNNNDKGTTFKFNILATQTIENLHNTNQTDILKKLKTMDLSKYKVLIIEDTATNVQLLKKMLSQFKFQIKVATNGKDGVQMYNEFKPQISFVDKNMPIKNGEETITEIRENEKKLKIKTSIISLSADTFPEDIKAMLDAGANLYMKKPFTVQELYNTLYSSLNFIDIEQVNV